MTVRLWDLAAVTAWQSLEGHSAWVTAVAFSPDGKLLASASNDCTVKLWDPATGVALQTFKGHSGGVKAVAFSRDGKLLASASFDLTVRLWDATTGEALQRLQLDVVVAALSFSSDGSCLETDRGLIGISPFSGIFSWPTLPRGIFVKERWIARGTENLIWLPSDYRPSSAAVCGDVVVLGHLSGRVSILGFAV
jgi:WD40 repeat protein